MKLKRLKIKGFRNIADFSREIGDGLILFKGPNEAGKSSLMTALFYVLFHDPKSTAEVYKGSGNWGRETLYNLVLDFEHNGDSFVLEKDFNKKTSLLKNNTTGDEWSGKSKINSKLTDILGFFSEDVYKSTACVFQDELHAINSGQKELRSLLERQISGTYDVDTEDVVRELKKQTEDLKRGMDRPAPKNPGIIRVLIDEVKELEGRKDEISEKVLKLKEARGRIREVSKELDDLERSLIFKKEVLDRIRQFVRAKERKEVLSQSLDGILANLEKIEEAEKKIGKLGADFGQQRESLRQKEEYLERCRKAKMEKELAEKVKLRGEAKKTLIVLVLSVVTVISWIVFAAIDSHGFSQFTPIDWLIVAVGAVIACFIPKLICIVTYWVMDGFRKDRGRIEKDIGDKEFELKVRLGAETLETLDKEIDDPKIRVKETERRFNELKDYMVSDKEIEAKEREVLSLRENTRSLEAEISRNRGILDTLDKDELEKDRKVRARETSVVDTLLDDLKRFEAGNEELVQKEAELKKLEDSVSNLKAEKGKWEYILEDDRYGQEDIAGLEERIDVLKKRLERMKLRLTSYGIIDEVLSEARQKVVGEIFGDIDEKIGQYFSIITNGKYDKVSLSRNDFSLMVYSEDKGDWVNPDTSELSVGARDQLYLAARLSMANSVTEENYLPIMLDDPLVHFDEKRRLNAISLLKKIAKTRQVFVFSCHDYYDSCVDRKVELQL